MKRFHLVPGKKVSPGSGQKGFTFCKGETFKPPSPAAAPRNVCRRFQIQRFLKGAAHRNMSKMVIAVRCTLCLVWVAVFLSILSVRCTLTEKGFTFCKGETFKPRPLVKA